MKVIARQFHAKDNCPLCRGRELDDRLTLDGIRIASCKACNFMFSRETMQAVEIDQFYIDGYHDQRHMDGQRVNATININVLRRFCPDLSGRSLLDIGCGYGFLLDRARECASVAGVELSQAQRDYSTRTLQLKTYDKLEDLTADDRFDVITLFEVIEHIPEPREFILHVCDRLKPGGSLIIGTDNFSADVVTVLGRQFPKWIPHEHVSFFTGTTLTKMLEGLGPLKLAGVRSFTPWELQARKLLFRATSGRRGGMTYNYENARSVEQAGGYRFFSLRMAINRVWFGLTSGPNLGGEMMYIHAVKR
jgi:2-polyprenyl-3-methyl-5-hydroxy-6-metoxy-1,4-benzoquinol methylase